MANPLTAAFHFDHELANQIAGQLPVNAGYPQSEQGGGRKKNKSRSKKSRKGKKRSGKKKTTRRKGSRSKSRSKSKSRSRSRTNKKLRL